MIFLENASITGNDDILSVTVAISGIHQCIINVFLQATNSALVFKKNIPYLKPQVGSKKRRPVKRIGAWSLAAIP